MIEALDHVISAKAANNAQTYTSPVKWRQPSINPLWWQIDVTTSMRSLLEFSFDPASQIKDLLRYRRNTSPNLILWNYNLGITPGAPSGWIFGPWLFHSRNLDQDFPNERSNLILCPLEAGHWWVVQTWPFLKNYEFWHGQCKNWCWHS